MNFDLGALGASVCAIACVCTGSIFLLGFMLIRVLGFGALPIITELAGTLLGGGDNSYERKTSPERAVTAQSAAQSLRERARATSFEEALQRQGGAIAAVAQSQTPYRASSQSVQPGLSQPQNAPLSRPTHGGLTPSPRADLSSPQPLSGRNPGLRPQQAPLQSAQPQQPFPQKTPPLNRNLPSLSQRTPAQPSNPGSGEYRPPLRRGAGNISAGSPSGGLRNRDSRRRENNTIYDDNAGDMDGIFGMLDL